MGQPTGFLEQMSLGDIFGLPMNVDLVEKDWFRRRFIRFRRLFLSAGFLYESGAVLGRQVSGAEDALSMIWSAQTTPTSATEMWLTLAEERLTSYERSVGDREPKDFAELLIQTALPGRSEAILDGLEHIRDKKMKASEAMWMLYAYLFESVGFGWQFPDLTAEMTARTGYIAWDASLAWWWSDIFTEGASPLTLPQLEAPIIEIVTHWRKGLAAFFGATGTP